jgi:uncharacterized membrane protein YkvA (DUF1232 family)
MGLGDDGPVRELVDAALPAVLGVGAGLLLAWAALVVALWVARPRDVGLRDALRLTPDAVRLLRRLATDPTVPRRARVLLLLLAAYLAFPLDLVPDVVPVLGWADDAVLVVLVLRHVVRVAGPHALARHWSGTPEGLDALRRLAGLPDQRQAPGT